MKLESYQRDFIKKLARAKIGGNSEDEVVWFLLQMAITELTQSGYVRKHLEDRDLLRGKDK